MAVFLDFLSCAEHQSYCGKHNLVFTLSCMPLQPNNRRTKWPRNSHYTPNIQNVSVGAATNIVQPRTFSVAMALVEHSILLKCWAKIGISGAIGVSRMPLTQRQRVNIQRNLTVAGLPYWRLSMAALLRIADRVGLRAKRPQLAECCLTNWQQFSHLIGKLQYPCSWLKVIKPCLHIRQLLGQLDNAQIRVRQHSGSHISLPL